MKTKIKTKKSYKIQDNINLNIVDSSELYIGYKSNGWILAKEYEHFNLWERKTLCGDIIRECFYKYEAPKKVDALHGY